MGGAWNITGASWEDVEFLLTHGYPPPKKTEKSERSHSTGGVCSICGMFQGPHVCPGPATEKDLLPF